MSKSEMKRLSSFTTSPRTPEETAARWERQRIGEAAAQQRREETRRLNDEAHASLVQSVHDALTVDELRPAILWLLERADPQS